MRPSPSGGQTQSVVFEAVPAVVVLALTALGAVLVAEVLVSAVVVLALTALGAVLVAEVLVLAVVVLVLMLIVNQAVQQPRLYSHLAAN